MPVGPGGKRNRSGPPPSPQSVRSIERRGAMTVLPAGGYQGPAPEFPLPDPSERELAVWLEAWTTPQAAAWALEPWRWRTVGLWARWSVRIEDPKASAALGNVVVRLSDQIGLTPASLLELGWVVGDADTVSTVPSRPGQAPTPQADIRRRLKEGTALERARKRAERPPDPRDALHAG